jgi:hypothetical protein
VRCQFEKVLEFEALFWLPSPAQELELAGFMVARIKRQRSRAASSAAFAPAWRPA